MTRSIREHVRDCLEQVLARGAIHPQDVDYLVLSTSDACLERVRSFAIFGDAVAGCLISREPADGSLELLDTGLTTDYLGLAGTDSFASRQQAARAALDKVFGPTGEQLNKATKVLGPNLFQAVTLFNAAAAGIPRPQLHASPAVASYGHCSNADWIINLIDYEASTGIASGALYLVLSTAPGFFACGLLRGK